VVRVGGTLVFFRYAGRGAIQYIKTMRVMSKTSLTTGIFCASADFAPALAGAYVLPIELAESVRVALPGKPAADFIPPLPLLRLGAGAGRPRGRGCGDTCAAARPSGGTSTDRLCTVPRPLILLARWRTANRCSSRTRGRRYE